MISVLVVSLNQGFSRTLVFRFQMVRSLKVLAVLVILILYFFVYDPGMCFEKSSF